MILLTALLILAGDVEAQPTKAAKPKLVCKTVQMTGTRLGGGKRECRTKASWDAYQRASEDDARTLIDTAPLPRNPGG